MDYLSEIFLNHIADEIFSGNALVQECTFKHRFNPDNKNYPHKYEDKAGSERKPKKNIADLVAKKIGGDYQSSIAQHIAEVIKKIYKTYQEEMEQDGITQSQLQGTRGRMSSNEDAPWEITYKWLWEDKYPHWLQDYIWDSWKQQAQTNKKWIRFSEITLEYSSKGMVIPQAPSKETLPVDTPLSLEIDVDSPGSYLLLFNRGQDIQGNTTKYLVAPSQAIAPNYQLVDKANLMPQQGAMLEDIKFNAEGKEEYIGILIDNALDLPWLNPDPENPALEWEGKHLNEVWKLLQSKDNWQVFYRDFEVTSPN
ncbi:hypothetical protein [Mastigocoleus testarum]|uniref:DUF4384 domain-containing protein n=1 Tax=Mastigocoleus testarum BC008 TaxID=371196 RepID=A0A0V7ZLE0_9CYAN|nr:hypothetical protein [Mastigocoleus testarum]KST65218.1 hypothetical protein BC008_20690 [Mastigocoleus testarum BC008]